MDLPKIINTAALPPLVTHPTYTEIFEETVGNAGTDADGFPAQLAELDALAEAFLADITAAGIADVLGGVPLPDISIDVAPLDTTIGNYISTIPAGEQALSDLTTASPPDLLVLPLALDVQIGITLPPQQLSVDLGHVALPGTLDYTLGYTFYDKLGNPHGLTSVQLQFGDVSMWQVVQSNPLAKQNGGNTRADLMFTATHAGTFTAQVSLTGASLVPGMTHPVALVTFTVAVP